MTLNPAQFGALRNSEYVENHDMGVDDEPYFHGTTHAAAEKIAKSGFSLAQQSNGRSGGEGVYLHDNAARTEQYGDTTVAAGLSNLRIHQNPYNDEFAMKFASTRAQEHGGSIEDHLPTVMHVLGYHGHHDPDDNSTVVYDPKNVHYLTHFNQDTGSGRV